MSGEFPEKISAVSRHWYLCRKYRIYTELRKRQGEAMDC